jgi:hypothetical protein
VSAEQKRGKRTPNDCLWQSGAGVDKSRLWRDATKSLPAVGRPLPEPSTFAHLTMGYGGWLFCLVKMLAIYNNQPLNYYVLLTKSIYNANIL